MFYCIKYDKNETIQWNNNNNKIYCKNETYMEKIEQFITTCQSKQKFTTLPKMLTE